MFARLVNAQYCTLIIRARISITWSVGSFFLFYQKIVDLFSFYPLLLQMFNSPIQKLITASKNGKLTKVQRLLDKEVDVNSQDDNGATALMHASACGNFGVVKALQGYNGRELVNILKEASHNGYLEVVELLIQRNADVNIQDDYGWTPLICASILGHTQVFKALLAKNANVDHQNNEGSTAMTWASFGGCIEIVQALLEEGANVDLCERHGITGLMFASQEGHLEIMRMLIGSNANVNIQDGNGWTALMWASICGQIDSVRLLLDQGADIMIKNNHGRTAQQFADIYGHEEIVSILAEVNRCFYLSQDDVYFFLASLNPIYLLFIPLYQCGNRSKDVTP